MTMVNKLIHSVCWHSQKALETPLGNALMRKTKKSFNKKNNPRELKLERQVIVSLTSYPARFKDIHLCLQSILNQTVKVDHIIVWFGSDVNEGLLTNEMKMLEQFGVEYRYDTDKNLKPHKKYFYAMQEYPNDIVITVDDDVVYPRGMVARLIKEHIKYPNAICAGRVHRIIFDKNGSILPYSSWMHEDDLIKEPSFRLTPIGIGGVLYPPGCLDERVFCLEGIEKCINADDLWLKCAAVSKGTKTVRAGFASRFLREIEDSQKTALRDTNVNQNKNDEYLKIAMDWFGLSAESFQK